MAAALIVIEIAAPKVSDEALSVLVASCNRAARDASCVLGKNASDVQPAAVAIVSLQGDDTMRVEVGVRQGGADSWRSKDFAFLAADLPLDRWRAVGFAIGTLAENNPPPTDAASAEPRSATPAGASSARGAATAEAAPTESSASTAPSASTTPSASTAPRASTAPSAPTSPTSDSPGSESDPRSPEGPERGSSETRVLIDVAGIGGAGLDKGPPRLGGLLEAALGLPPLRPVLITWGGSAAIRVGSGSNEASVRWFDAFAGIAVPLFGSAEQTGFELKTSLVTEYFEVAASRNDQSDKMSRWLLGARGGLSGRLQVLPALCLTAGVEVTGLSGATTVVVGTDSVGTAAALRYLGSVGFRVRLR